MTRNETPGRMPLAAEGPLLYRVAEALYRRLFWAVSVLGVPPAFIVQLEVEGRKTKRPRSTVLVTATHAGDRYLVSVIGDRADWVRNLRLVGGRATLRHGRRTPVLLEEVSMAERAPILRAYLRWALGARRVFGLRPSDSLEKFNAIASEHPVFRIRARS